MYIIHIYTHTYTHTYTRILYIHTNIHTYVFTLQKLINNSSAKHKGNHSREGVFICDKTHVDFHKTFASIFSAYTTSILKILS